MTTRLTSSRSGSMSNASKKKNSSKKVLSTILVLLQHVLLEQVDMVVGVGLRGQQVEGGGGQLLLLWPVMATEGASQSDFVPVTTGDPCGCPVGQGLAPHQPTLSVSLLWAPSSAAGRCRHILLQHTMMNFMTYFALFGVLWNSIKNNSE